MLFLSCYLLLSVSFSYERRCSQSYTCLPAGAMQASPLHTTEMQSSYTCLPAGGILAPIPLRKPAVPLPLRCAPRSKGTQPPPPQTPPPPPPTYIFRDSFTLNLFHSAFMT